MISPPEEDGLLEARGKGDDFKPEGLLRDTSSSIELGLNGRVERGKSEKEGTLVVVEGYVEKAEGLGRKGWKPRLSCCRRRRGTGNAG